MGIIHACFGEHGSIGIILAIHSQLTDARFGCVCGPIGLDKIRAASPLVLPLPYVHRSRLRVYRFLFVGLPVQKAGWCARCSSCMVILYQLCFWIRYFGGDRSGTEGAQYERTKLLPPDHKPRCSPHNGFLHFALYWVRTHPGPPVTQQVLFSFCIAVSRLLWAVGLSPTSSTFVVEGRLQVTSLLGIGVVSPWVVLDCSGSTDSLVNGGRSSFMVPLLLCTKMHLILQPGC